MVEIIGLLLLFDGGIVITDVEGNDCVDELTGIAIDDNDDKPVNDCVKDDGGYVRLDGADPEGCGGRNPAVQ